MNNNKDLIETNTKVFNEMCEMFNERNITVLVFMGIDNNGNVISIFSENLHKETIGKIIIQQGNNVLIEARKEKFTKKVVQKKGNLKIGAKTNEIRSRFLHKK